VGRVSTAGIEKEREREVADRATYRGCGGGSERATPQPQPNSTPADRDATPGCVIGRGGAPYPSTYPSGSTNHWTKRLVVVVVLIARLARDAAGLLRLPSVLVLVLRLRAILVGLFGDPVAVFAILVLVEPRVRVLAAAVTAGHRAGLARCSTVVVLGVAINSRCITLYHAQHQWLISHHPAPTHCHRGTAMPHPHWLVAVLPL